MEACFIIKKQRLKNGTSYETGCDTEGAANFIVEILNEKDGKFHGAPELVIKILSPGRVNARRDLQIKRELYEIFGVPEYWVIKPQEKEIEVFQPGKASKIYTENEFLKTAFLPKFKLKIKQLFAN